MHVKWKTTNNIIQSYKLGTMQPEGLNNVSISYKQRARLATARFVFRSFQINSLANLTT